MEHPLKIHLVKHVDKFDIISIDGNEHISDVFQYQIDVKCRDLSIKPESLIGTPVSVEITYNASRFFHGRVQSVSTDNIADETRETSSLLHLVVVPWFWFLSKTSSCRIFENKNTIEIVESIFSFYDKSFAKFECRINNTFSTRRYCVQFNESDFDFVTRLLAEDGISYYFEHSKDSHTLILDNKKTHKKCDEYEVAFYEHILGWEEAHSFISNKLTHAEYNCEMPKKSLVKSLTSELPVSILKDFETYVWPGHFSFDSEGETLAKARLESEEVEFELNSGSSHCASFSPGRTINLTRNKLDDSKAEEYTIVQLSFSASNYESSYSNSFYCIPGARFNRPVTSIVKPVMNGPQTAFVVSPKGDEIDFDQRGAIKVQFHWQDKAETAEQKAKIAKCTCYVRVAQSLAADGWGSQYIPRVGQEVIVDFIGGDPDRPIVTGGVYNGEGKLPFDSKTKSGIKTRSSPKGNKTNFNELSFEDLKGSEKIYIHAEKDMLTEAKNTIVLEAKTSVTLKVGCSTICIENNLITIDSEEVKINC